MYIQVRVQRREHTQTHRRAGSSGYFSAAKRGALFNIFKFKKDKADDIVYFYGQQIQKTKTTNNELIQLANSNTAHFSKRLVHWVTCSFIIMNTHTVVYFGSFQHIPSCCPKYSLQHQMWIHLPLKIVPKQWTIFSCLSNVCSKVVASCFRKSLSLFF